MPAQAPAAARPAYHPSQIEGDERILHALGDFEAAAGNMLSVLRGTISIGTILNPQTIRLGAVLQYMASTPLATSMAEADDKARAGLLADVNAKLEPYLDDQGVTFPIESHVVVARK